MHKVQESASEHLLIANKYRQRRQTQRNFSSANEIGLPRSLVDSDKENQSSDLNKSNLQFRFGEKTAWTPQDLSISQFSISRLTSAINLVDKTLIDCFMVKSQADRSLRCLGTFCLTRWKNCRRFDTFGDL